MDPISVGSVALIIGLAVGYGLGRHIERRRIAPPRLFLKALQTNRFQVPRQLWIENRGRTGSSCCT